MTNIFENQIAMDVFCMNICEAWIEWTKSRGKVSGDSFEEWVEEFAVCLMYNFEDVYEAEFGHSEYDED